MNKNFWRNGESVDKRHSGRRGRNQASGRRQQSFRRRAIVNGGYGSDALLSGGVDRKHRVNRAASPQVKVRTLVRGICDVARSEQSSNVIVDGLRLIGLFYRALLAQ
jgi:hypothetical protein